MARHKVDKENEPIQKSRVRRFASLPIRLILLILLLIWLMYVLADSFGIEGEGGWLGEVLGAFLFILGIIFAAAAMFGAFVIVRKASGEKDAGPKPWENTTIDGKEDNSEPPQDRAP